MVHHDQTGIFHLAGRDVVSRYALALSIAKTFGLDEGLIHPVDSDFFTHIAPRPKNTSYTTHKMEIELGLTPLSLLEGLIYVRDHFPLYLRDTLFFDVASLGSK